MTDLNQLGTNTLRRLVGELRTENARLEAENAALNAECYAKSEQVARMDDRRRALRAGLDRVFTTGKGVAVEFAEMALAADDKAAAEMKEMMSQ